MEVAGTSITQLLSNMSTEYSKFEQVLAAGGVSKGMLEMKLRAGDAMGAIQLVAQGLTNIAAVDKLAATQAMKDLGLQGFRSLQVLQALVTQMPKFQENLAAISDPIKNAMSLQEKYNAAIDTMTQRWNATKNALTIIKQVIGKELANAIERVLERYLNPLVTRFADWVQNSASAQLVLKSLGEVIELIGKKLFDVGNNLSSWLEGFGEIKTSTNIAMELDKTLDKVWKNVKGIIPSFEEFKKAVMGAFAGVKKAFEDGFGWWLVNGKDIVTVFVDTTQSIKEMFALLRDAKRIFKDFSDGFWDSVAKPLTKLDEMLSKIQGKDENVIVGMMNKATDGMENLSKAAVGLGKDLYGESLFPDWVMWAQKTGVEMTDLVGEVKELADTVNLSVSEFDNVMGQTGIGLEGMKEKLAGFSEEQLTMLSSLGSGFLRMTTDQMENTLMVMETVKAASDTLSTQSASSLSQISKRIAELTLSDPAFGAIAGAKSLASASAALRSGQGSVQDQFAAQKLAPIMPANIAGQPINNLQATIKLGDEEIGTIAAAINDQNAQTARRTTSSGWSGSSSRAKAGNWS
jgi:hypothetical protein